MVEQFYRITLEIVSRYLSESGTTFSIEDGDVLLAGHRLGVSIAFDGFARQDDQWIAPLDIQLHLDGDAGDRFRVGTLGVGDDTATAAQAAVEQWYVLAAKPVLAALGAFSPGRRRLPAASRLAGWDLFPGQVGLRGQMPSQPDALSHFYQELLKCIETSVAAWERPERRELHSVYLMATREGDSCEVQAARDGYVDNPLSETIAALDWPRSAQTYLYKQLFVLRAPGANQH